MHSAIFHQNHKFYLGLWFHKQKTILILSKLEELCFIVVKNSKMLWVEVYQ